jgi:hypothetical protein
MQNAGTVLFPQRNRTARRNGAEHSPDPYLHSVTFLEKVNEKMQMFCSSHIFSRNHRDFNSSHCRMYTAY